MKTILIIALLCMGCASSVTTPTPPPAPPPCPKVTTCSDELRVLNDEDLTKGYTCPAGSRITFPSYFSNTGKVLVLCQCNVLR